MIMYGEYDYVNISHAHSSDRQWGLIQREKVSIAVLCDWEGLHGEKYTDCMSNT